MNEVIVTSLPVPVNRAIDPSPTIKTDLPRKPVIDANVVIGEGPTRLQITADVDLAGLKKLRELIAKYEEIFTLMSTPLDQFEQDDAPS